MNRRSFFRTVTAAVAALSLPKVASDYVPAMVTPGEFVISKKYLRDLYISPEALQDIRDWSRADEKV